LIISDTKFAGSFRNGIRIEQGEKIIKRRKNRKKRAYERYETRKEIRRWRSGRKE
jgi:hypothetical protein